MTTRIACLVLGTAVAALSCSRDLTQVTDRDVEPAYLGDLSGLYSLSIMGPLEENPIAPLDRRVRLLHVRNPEGGADRLLGAEEASMRTETEGSNAGARLFFQAAFDGRIIDGDSNRGPFFGKRVAGGAMFAVEPLLRVCPSGEAYPVVGELLCPTNPALSGVYGGASTVCDGDGSDSMESFLALGFIEDSFIGLSYPGAETLVEGGYSHATEHGAGESYGILFGDNQEVQGSAFTFDLKEDTDEISLGGDLFTFECGVNTCSETCRSISLSRLAGGTASECFADDVNTAIGNVFTHIEFIHDERYLLVETDYMDVAFRELGIQPAEGFLRRADDHAVVIPGEKPNCMPPRCDCFVGCCECDRYPSVCDGGCDCDPDCAPDDCECIAAPAEHTDGSCSGDCACDQDCYSGAACGCDGDNACTPDCFCDPDCECPCERLAFGIRFPLPNNPPAEGVEYELFLTVFDPFYFEYIPTVPTCIRNEP